MQNQKNQNNESLKAYIYDDNQCWLDFYSFIQKFFPLKDLSIQTQEYSQHVPQINLEFEFHDAGALLEQEQEKTEKDVIALQDWPKIPFLHVFIINTDSIENYQQVWREKLTVFLQYVTRVAPEQPIVVIFFPGKSKHDQKKSKSLMMLFEAILQDGQENLQISRQQYLKIVNCDETQSHSESLVEFCQQQFVAVFKIFLVQSIESRLQFLEQQIYNFIQKKIESVSKLHEYFLLKESLSVILQNINLFADALQKYEQFNNLLNEFLLRGQIEYTPEPLHERHQNYQPWLTEVDGIKIRDRIQEQQVDLFLLLQYLYGQICSLHKKLNFPIEALERVKYFIRTIDCFVFEKYKPSSQEDQQKYSIFRSVWTYQTIMGFHSIFHSIVPLIEASRRTEFQLLSLDLKLNALQQLQKLALLCHGVDLGGFKIKSFKVELDYFLKTVKSQNFNYMSDTLEKEIKNQENIQFLLDLIVLKNIQDPQLIGSIQDLKQLLQNYAKLKGFIINRFKLAGHFRKGFGIELDYMKLKSMVRDIQFQAVITDDIVSTENQEIINWGEISCVYLLFKALFFKAHGQIEKFNLMVSELLRNQFLSIEDREIILNSLVNETEQKEPQETDVKNKLKSFNPITLDDIEITNKVNQYHTYTFSIHLQEVIKMRAQFDQMVFVFKKGEEKALVEILDLSFDCEKKIEIVREIQFRGSGKYTLKAVYLYQGSYSIQINQNYILSSKIFKFNEPSLNLQKFLKNAVQLNNMEALLYTYSPFVITLENINILRQFMTISFDYQEEALVCLLFILVFINFNFHYLKQISKNLILGKQYLNEKVQFESIEFSEPNKIVIEHQKDQLEVQIFIIFNIRVLQDGGKLQSSELQLKAQGFNDQIENKITSVFSIENLSAVGINNEIEWTNTFPQSHKNAQFLKIINNTLFPIIIDNSRQKETLFRGQSFSSWISRENDILVGFDGNEIFSNKQYSQQVCDVVKLMDEKSKNSIFENSCVNQHFIRQQKSDDNQLMINIWSKSRDVCIGEPIDIEYELKFKFSSRTIRSSFDEEQEDSDQEIKKEEPEKTYNILALFQEHESYIIVGETQRNLILRASQQSIQFSIKFVPKVEGLYSYPKLSFQSIRYVRSQDTWELSDLSSEEIQINILGDNYFIAVSSLPKIDESCLNFIE